VTDVTSANLSSEVEVMQLPQPLKESAMRITKALALDRLPTKGTITPISLLLSLRQIFGVCLLLLVVAGAAWARSPIAAVNTEDGLAIKGYDPVSYFTTGEPMRGSAEFSTAYQGALYRFVSAENRDRFLAEPQKYLPQYGGYCAYAISLNYIADIDPEEWAIVNNKLYLNNGFFAQTLWSLDKSGNIEKGDRNWPLVPKLAEPKS
jgi:YHS domain-containing protein